jgi:metal-dependent hydrolase (beta-lactamase superfamily II)
MIWDDQALVVNVVDRGLVVVSGCSHAVRSTSCDTRSA